MNTKIKSLLVLVLIFLNPLSLFWYKAFFREDLNVIWSLFFSLGLTLAVLKLVKTVRFNGFYRTLFSCLTALIVSIANIYFYRICYAYYYQVDLGFVSVDGYFLAGIYSPVFLHVLLAFFWGIRNSGGSSNNLGRSTVS